MENYDWRALPVLMDKYVESVFNADELHSFPISEASDHYINTIERMWHLKIDESVAVDIIIYELPTDLRNLILISEALNN